MLRARTRSCLIIGAIVSTCAIWYWLDFAPLVWSALIWVVVLSVLYAYSKTQRGRKILTYVGAVLLGITFAEGALWTTAVIAKHRFLRQAQYDLLSVDVLKQRTAFYVKEGPLGLEAPAGGSMEDRTMIGKDVVFDVRYDIDSEDLRVSPPASAVVVGCVLFFGDSYIFGWGVSDRQTAPYQVGLQSGGRFRVYNFAFPGYGAQQTLAQIQDGMVKKVVKCDEGKPVYAIDEILPDYVTRARALYFNAPRYILTRNGSVARRGTLGIGDYVDNDTVYVNPIIFCVLRKTQLYKWTIGKEGRPNDFDRRRLVAMIAESRRALHLEFPNVKFMATVWDNYGFPINTAKVAEREALVAALKRQGIDARGIDVILPNYNSDPFEYRIPHEYHPNAKAHRLFASYLLSHFIYNSAEDHAGSPRQSVTRPQ